jgi:hypothetical protein
MLGFSHRKRLTSFRKAKSMKIWKNLGFLLVSVAIILACSSCAKKHAPVVQSVSDGYVITVDEESLKNIKDDNDYTITLVDVAEAKTADRDAIKAAMSDSSRYSSVEGKANKVGAHKVKITTDSKLTIDLTRPFATFLGVNSKRLSDLVSGGQAASADCSCGGIPDMKQVTCHEAPSTLCCTTCP